MVARPKGPRAAGRGSAAKRAGARADKDGDISMGTTVKGRGGISKSTAPTGSKKELTGKGAKGGILSATAQREILRKAGAGDVSMKESRVTGTRGGLVELKVTGWQKSKVSGTSDGGVSNLIQWLEKKASSRLGSKGRSVKIRKSQIQEPDLIIKVASEDVGALVRMNGYSWAGVNVGIERLGGAAQDASGQSNETQKLKDMFKSVLERRYDFETKFLNMSALAEDQDLKDKKLFDTKSTESKFFPAMMKVLEAQFDKPEEKDAAVTSLSLANNGLEELTAVKELSATLPKLLNLDLSNNKFANLNALTPWRKRFYHLQHLIVTGNPLEQTEPNYAQTLTNWYPNLRQLNGIQVRTEEDVANKNKVTNLPFPIRSALFQDEGGIAEGFIRKFFPAFDTNRNELAQHYYDDKSEFSYSVNTMAPADPENSQKTEKGEWEQYLKSSRNLKRISQLPARQSRISRGSQAVATAFAALPATKHPDLIAEARKWLIEAKMIPGVPDPSGASANGVDGFLITVSGEFDEVSGGKKRSFDRTIVLGPGAGPDGVRIVSDLLTIRGYGGMQAYEPENVDISVAQPQPAQLPVPAAPVEPAPPALPAGLSLELAEQMVQELSKRTNMTIAYAKDCLDQTGWNGDAALAAFESVKGSLPPDAFVQPVA
ncbi:hypothetical protein KC363_g6373 [Hortaea werneckii]|uniref:NTF2 domain-containing protein n=1 Tax=Hortaea werneckii TaxID=91943 RepID=A0A3M7F3S0_HORWE|nr:hypothetical protein KC363_g6373 [Hortaea werneckii]KAI7507179.1 hypothetical protein KC347_g7049 [Hortaea werneckii]RMY83515.1 hypothetical protein D0861_07383 [Hortaea werneckii]